MYYMDEETEEPTTCNICGSEECNHRFAIYDETFGSLDDGYLVDKEDKLVDKIRKHFQMHIAIHPAFPKHLTSYRSKKSCKFLIICKII